MIETISSINSAVSGIVWGLPATALIFGVGLYLSIRTGFLQFRKFGTVWRNTIGKLFQKTPEAGKGAVTPFQAVCTALAATVGTGNIAGVAGAIAIGGPGAVFWMWISALLGMVTKYSEVTLAVLFSIFGVFAVFGTGNATQVNTIVASIDAALINFGVIGAEGTGTLNLILGIAIALLVALVLLGGIKRIGRVTERLVPFMALLYVVLGLGVVVINIEHVPGVFAAIVKGAFNPAAVTGGVVGAMFTALQKGVARGIFSNEAGLGTASIAHAGADVKDPVQQGLFGVFEVFIDTIVICTLTALVILCSGAPFTYGAAAGAELTISGFTSSYGSWVSIFTAVALCCFAFSTILGWGLYGSRCCEYLFGEKIIKPFMVVYALVAILGATMDLGLLWDIAETFNGMMAIPNLIGVALLSPVVLKLTKEYFTKEKESPLCK